MMSDRKTTVQLAVELVTCAVPVVAERGAVLLVLDGVVIGVQRGKLLDVSHKAMDQAIERAHEHKRVPPAPPAKAQPAIDPRTGKQGYYVPYENMMVFVPAIHTGHIRGGRLEAIPPGYWIDADGALRMKRRSEHGPDVLIAPNRRKTKANRHNKPPRPYADVNAVAFKIIDLLHDNDGVIGNLPALDLLGLRHNHYGWMFRDAVERLVVHNLVERVGSRLRYDIKATDLARLREVREKAMLSGTVRTPEPEGSGPST